jgi:CRP/FNR family transcriptional regulator, cyclic AMP receptor protein
MARRSSVAGEQPSLSGAGPHGSFGGGGPALLLTEHRDLTFGPAPLFQNLSDAERDMVLKMGRRRVLYRGATLFSQGGAHEGIYLIESGRIRVFYMAPSGREITLAYWFPGNFVGGPDVFGGGTHNWSGVAAANSSVVLLPGPALRRLVLQIPNLAVGIIEGLAFKGRCYSALAQMLGTRSVTERLAHLLRHLVATYGVENEEGMQICVNFTHAEIAHMVGATRQWVTISLKRLQEQGVLNCGRAGITVLNMEALERIRIGGK